MRRIYGVLLMFFILISASSCDLIWKSGAEKTAYEFVQEYFTFYDTEKIIDYESYAKLEEEFFAKFKPYMTDKAYNSFIVNKDPYQIFDIAARGRAAVEIKDIRLRLKDEYAEDNSLYYEYTGEIFITPFGSIQPERRNAKIAGEIMLTKQDNTFKVTHFMMRGTAEWFELRKNFESVLY